MTDYKAFPATAEAGPATIVFENSMATGSTFGMSHTLTFDTSSPGYNHDVNLNILASPFDANGGRHEAQVTFTPGKYRYFCAIPGHGEMWGELVVTDGGTGGEDTTAPSVTALVTGEQDGDGAYVGGATVTLDATDDDSGVAGVEYDLDGAGWQAYTEPFVVDAVGAHTLQFRATDAAGNTSEAQTASFTVVEGDVEEDTTAPVVEPMVMGQQDEDGAYVGTAAFMLHATDEGSGVASVEYQVDGGAWLPYTTTVPFTEVGEHTVSFRATDVAGNVSEVGSVTFTVVAGGGEDDTTAPTVTAEVTGTQDGNGAFVGSATATLTATDDASGVESVEYDLDGAGWQPYTEPVVVDEPGEHTLVYRATDVAGNVSEETVTEFVVVAEAEEDTTAPIVATELSGQQDEDGAYVGSASVLLTATDDGSGVASVEYDLDGAGWTEYTEAVVVDEPGRHTLAYRATDVAGTSASRRPSRSTSSRARAATLSPRPSTTASWAATRTRPASTSTTCSCASSRRTPTPASRRSSTSSTAASGPRTPSRSPCGPRVAHGDLPRDGRRGQRPPRRRSRSSSRAARSPAATPTAPSSRRASAAAARATATSSRARASRSRRSTRSPAWTASSSRPTTARGSATRPRSRSRPTASTWSGTARSTASATSRAAR